ncbi:hypothetical protein, partial [Methanopyrus sp.]
MFLIRSVPEDGFRSCTYGVVPSDAMYLADLVLQSLEDRVDELLGVEFSSSSIVLESITGDVGVVLLTGTDPESVVESVSRVLGSDRVEGVRGEDAGDVVDYLETVLCLIPVYEDSNGGRYYLAVFTIDGKVHGVLFRVKYDKIQVLS